MLKTLVGFGYGITTMPLPLTFDDAAETTPAPECAGRAESLLRTMHKTLSHDLPNQLVVLQSLVHLLQTEEADRLGVDGQEYTQRIQNVARKATGMVRFLKEMARLADYVPHVEEVALPVLAREIKAVLTQQYPQRKLGFTWTWAVPTVRTDARMLQNALLELLQRRVESPHRLAAIHGGSREGPDGVEISFSFAPPAERADEAIGASRHETPTELLLARAWLAQADARLSADGDGFVVHLAEPPHD